MTGMFFLAAALSANCVDPRVRTYVEPVRIVWQSPKAEGFGEVRVRAAKRGDGGLDVDVQAPEGVRIVGR